MRCPGVWSEVSRQVDDEMNRSTNLVPLTGMCIGAILGTMLGVAAVMYLEVQPLLDQFCLVGIALMMGQLFGAVVAGTFGKPGS